MRVSTVVRLLALPATVWILQGCLGSGAPSSDAGPLPVLTHSVQPTAAEGAAELTPEQARAQAVAEIRAKAQAHQAQQDSAPYPDVFAAHGPPLAIGAENKSEHQIEAELAAVRKNLERASDPGEVAGLEQRMARLLELGRTHAQRSEQQIQANSEKQR